MEHSIGCRGRESIGRLSAPVMLVLDFRECEEGARRGAVEQAEKGAQVLIWLFGPRLRSCPWLSVGPWDFDFGSAVSSDGLLHAHVATHDTQAPTLRSKLWSSELAQQRGRLCAVTSRTRWQKTLARVFRGPRWSTSCASRQAGALSARRSRVAEPFTFLGFAIQQQQCWNAVSDSLSFIGLSMERRVGGCWRVRRSWE